MYVVSCVFRRADIGPPIIGYSVVREKSLFIGPLTGASVCLSLEAFLTLYAGRVIFVYNMYTKQKDDGWHRCVFKKYLTYIMYKELRSVCTMYFAVVKPP